VRVDMLKSCERRGVESGGRREQEQSGADVSDDFYIYLRSAGQMRSCKWHATWALRLLRALYAMNA
jgi:hypothetical protein